MSSGVPLHPAAEAAKPVNCVQSKTRKTEGEMSKVAKNGEHSERAPAPLTNVEQHAGLAAAKQKSAEVRARRDAVARELDAALDAKTSLAPDKLAREIEAVLDGSRPNDLEIAAARQVAELRNTLQVLDGACTKQDAEVRRQLKLAQAEVVSAFTPELPGIERRYFLALIELGKVLEERNRWFGKVHGAGVVGADAAQMAGADVFLPFIEGPQDCRNAFAQHLSAGLRRGTITRSEIPAHWQHISDGGAPVRYNRNSAAA
jgi:hypothetical protein